MPTIEFQDFRDDQVQSDALERARLVATFMDTDPGDRINDIRQHDLAEYVAVLEEILEEYPTISDELKSVIGFYALDYIALFAITNGTNVPAFQKRSKLKEIVEKIKQILGPLLPSTK